MKWMMSRRAALAGGTLAAVLRARKSAAETDGLTNLKLEQPPVAAPDFSFVDDKGTVHQLKDYPGDAFVVNLWATWCAPCTAELPSLDALAAKLANQPIKVLALSSDHGGAPVVQKFYQQHGIKNLAVLLDPQGRALEAFKARGVPTTFIIDAHGMEQAYAEGNQNWDTDAAITRVKELASV